MEFPCASVWIVFSVFAGTAGLMMTPGQNTTQPTLGWGELYGLKKDCYTAYDQKPFVRLTPCTQEMVDQMNAIIEVPHTGCIDVSHQGCLRKPRQGCANGAVICPFARAEELVLRFGSFAQIMVHDTGGQLRETSASQPPRATGLVPFRDFYSSFANLQQQQQYINTLIANSNGMAKLEVAGKSVEGRPIHVVRINGPGYVQGSSKKLMLTFQLHAREWISGMAGVHAIENVIKSAKANPSYLSNIQVVIMPNCNPDGFEYTQTDMRLWRKNRQKANDGGCAGVDLNRNFAVDWGGSGSTSNSSCSEVFIGRSALSEPESQVIASVMDDQTQVHIDFHSYSEMILRPWSYTTAAHPQAETINALGQELYVAVQTAAKGPGVYSSNVNYQYGGSEMLYEASGVLPDFTTDKGAFGYTVELSPGPNIMNGFEIGPEHIPHVNKESFSIIDAARAYILRGKVLRHDPRPPVSDQNQKFRKIRRPMVPVE